MIESPIHTIASSITATLSDSWLRLRWRTPRSAKILTITGTALTDRARPAYAAKVHMSASGPCSRGSAARARTTVETSGRPSAPRLISPTVRVRARMNPRSTVAPATPTSSTPQNAAMPRRNSF